MNAALAIPFVVAAALAPAAGANAPAFPTTSGATRSLADLRGRVVVLFYEDRHSRELNRHVKEALRRVLREAPGLSTRVAVIPVANVGGYDFWPARYFARRAVTRLAEKNGLEIWLDWKRALPASLGARDGTSSVLVLDREGAVRYRRHGPLAPAHLASLLKMLRELAGEEKMR